MKFLLALLFVLFIACTPAPAPITPIDASDASLWPTDASPYWLDAAPDDAFAIACLNLRAVGCPEGDAPNCADTMRTAQAARLANYAPSCVATQKSPEGIRACAPAWKNGCRGPRSSP